MAQLEALLAELETEETGEKVAGKVAAGLPAAPIEFREMPSPIGVPISNYKEYMTRDTGRKSKAKSAMPAFEDSVEGTENT